MATDPMRVIEREIEQILTTHRPRGPAFESLSADATRIATFLNDELDPAAQGVFIVACTAPDVLEPFALSHLRVAVDRAAERARLRDRARSASRGGQRRADLGTRNAALNRPEVPMGRGA
jgi:hypothetical protein